MAEENDQTTTGGDEAAKAAAEKAEAEKAEAAKAEEAKKAEAKAAEDKAAAEKAAAEKVPEKYDLKRSEGSLVSDKMLEKVVADSRASKYSNEDAQHLLEEREETLKDLVDEQKAQAEEWASLAKADKEIGGDKFEENAEIAARFVKKHGSEELSTFLEETGFGNHPVVIKFILKAAKGSGEDKIVPGTTGGKVKKTAVQALYGDKYPTDKGED
jgi:hypothetical protein